MKRNASLRSIIQDLKSEYPDVPERIIKSAVEQHNGYIPSIRATLDLHRESALHLACGHYGNMNRARHRSGDNLPPTRPISFPNFDQVGQPLSVDVNNDHLPNPYQMEAYIDHGLRPPPNRLNTSSPRMENEYVFQQRQSLQLMEKEVYYLENYLRGVKSDVRCREQLLSQREFGSDQKFPSKSDVDRLRNEVAQKRWEADYLDRSRNNTHIPVTYVESPYSQNCRPYQGIANSVSAPGTPDAPPYHNRGHRHPPPPMYNPVGYGYPPQQLMPRPPVPPKRSYSARPAWNPGCTISPRTPQPPIQVAHPPPNVTPPPPFRRGHSRTPSDGSRHSRHSSHRNSQASLGEQVISHGEEEENGEKQWNCSKCTFENHPAMRLCEMCETPRTKPADL